MRGSGGARPAAARRFHPGRRHRLQDFRILADPHCRLMYVTADRRYLGTGGGFRAADRVRRAGAARIAPESPRDRAEAKSS